MAIFRSIRFRGTVRIGRYIVACDPRIAVKSAMGVVDRFLYRRGVTARPIFSPAPYAIAQPLTRKDQLFIAQVAPPVGDVLIADYCFLTDAYPYALRPDARRLVIMHDLFSSRSSQFDSLNASDSVASVPLAEEVQMLSAADTIVAIQRDEAAVLQRKLPGHEILIAPIAALPVKKPQPGNADIVLFVGSSAAPNVDGIKWFIDFCWPTIRQRRPDAVLNIAGSVCSGLAQVPAGNEAAERRGKSGRSVCRGLGRYFAAACRIRTKDQIHRSPVKGEGGGRNHDDVAGRLRYHGRLRNDQR